MGDGNRLRYPRSARVRRGQEIRTLLKKSSRCRCGPLEVFKGESSTRSARAGIIVPLYGHTIVERNRLKRQLRELVRTEWLPRYRSRRPGQDILVRARPQAYGVEVSALREAFDRCVGGVE